MMLTVQEAAAALRVSVKTLRRAEKETDREVLTTSRSVGCATKGRVSYQGPSSHEISNSVRTRSSASDER